MRQRCNISVEKMIDIAQYKKSILNAISQAKTDHALEIINNLIAELIRIRRFQPAVPIRFR